MMLAQPVSAGTVTLRVKDIPGDIGKMYDLTTGEPTNGYGDNAPVVKAGYFDILSMWLSQKGKTYTFGMELAKELPQAGSALPSGVKFVSWNIWIDLAPWHPVLAPSDSLFTIALTYDGSNYAAVLIEGPGMLGNVIESLPFTIDGSIFQLQFSAASIGNLASFWWCPVVHAWWGPLGTGGQWWLDTVDSGAVPGQTWWDIPWPPQ